MADPEERTDNIEKEETTIEQSIDPGQLEGLPKTNEKEEFHGKIQERIDELTKNWRGTERDLKATIEKLTDKDEEIEVLINQNSKLMGIIEKGGVQSGSPKPIDPEVMVQTEIKTIRTQMSEARKKLEWEVYDQLEDKMNTLNEQLVDIKVKKQVGGTKSSSDTDTRGELNKDVVADFTSENPWFDTTSDEYDPIMRGAALELDDHLLTQKEWKDKPLKVRLKEVKKQIEKRFNTRSVGGPPRVEGSKTRTDGDMNSDTKGFGLSEAEKRVADRMIPLATAEERYKEYAKQKRLG